MYSYRAFAARTAAAAFLTLGTVAAGSAATIDFATTAFDSTFPGSLDPPSTASVAVDGVNFTVTAEAQGTNGFRQSFDHAGLKMGASGNGMYSISIVADADVTYTSFTGEDRSLSGFTSPQLFDLLLNGSVQQSGLSFGPSFGSVDFADISSSAGSVLKVDVDFTARPGYASLYAVAVLGALDFDKTPASAVPLPAGAPLLLAGFGALGLLRRRRRS